MSLFSIFKSKRGSGSSLVSQTIKISGLHCVSCGLNIDGELEELPGVSQSATNYAHSETKIKFDPNQTSLKQIESAITKLGYTVVST